MTGSAWTAWRCSKLTLRPSERFFDPESVVDPVRPADRLNSALEFGDQPGRGTSPRPSRRAHASRLSAASSPPGPGGCRNSRRDRPLTAAPERRSAVSPVPRRCPFDLFGELMDQRPHCVGDLASGGAVLGFRLIVRSFEQPTNARITAMTSHIAPGQVRLLQCHFVGTPLAPAIEAKPRMIRLSTPYRQHPRTPMPA